MKVLNIIKNIILDIVIVLLVGIIIILNVNRNKPVTFFNYYLFTVLSGSMEDTLKIGDNIIVKRVDEYKVGDIVTFKHDNIYVTHRITKIDGDMVTTKGDANTVEDEPFNKNLIIGKFVYKSDLLNFIINKKSIVVIILMALAILDYIVVSKKKVKKSAT